MATERSYFEYIAEQLAALPDVSFRRMMGEYILYYDGKVAGGLYDGRFLLKITPAGLRLLPDAPQELPYPGGRAMLLVEETDNAALFCEAVRVTAEALPLPKPKKKTK